MNNNKKKNRHEFTSTFEDDEKYIKSSPDGDSNARPMENGNYTSNQTHQHLKDNQIKIPQNRGPPFTNEIDNSIKEFMKEFDNLPNPYVKASEKINEKYNTNYTSKQIRQRWISKLDTKFCFKPLDEDEKLFIIQWIESNSREDTITWKELIPKMNDKFGNLHSENKVKNFWNLQKRSNLRKGSQESTKSKAENENSRKWKRSQLEVNDEQQKKKGCHEFTTIEYEYIKSSPLDGDSRSMKTYTKNEENILSPPLVASPKIIPSLPLNVSPMETPFKNEKNIIHLPTLNARPTGTPFKNEEEIIHLPPIRPMGTSEENIPSPPLNARQMGTPFKNEGIIHLPPLNARPMGTSFENANIHLPPNARPMEPPLRNEEIIPSFPLNARQVLKDEERIHSSPLNASPMETSSKNEENTTPLTAMEILCRVADAAYKRALSNK